MVNPYVHDCSPYCKDGLHADKLDVADNIQAIRRKLKELAKHFHITICSYEIVGIVPMASMLTLRIYWKPRKGCTIRMAE